VIAVTNVPGSTLEKIADVTLAIGSHSDKLIAVQTYTGTSACLCCCWRKRFCLGRVRDSATR